MKGGHISLPSHIFPALFLSSCPVLPHTLSASLCIALETCIMESINWSLNATDTVFSTRHSRSGEPVCPGGTFAAGYAMDPWEKWRVICLAILSVEDVEDIYIFGTMIAGLLLIGLGIILVYREIRKMVTAVQGPAKLPDMIDGVSGAVSAQTAAVNHTMENILERLSLGEAQTVAMNHNMENILEKLSALQRRMDRFGDQSGQTE